MNGNCFNLKIRALMACAALAAALWAAGAGCCGAEDTARPALPPFPEDGGRVMRAWYYSASAGPAPAALRAALGAEEVELRDIGYPYGWVQDIALFDSTGGLILQAELPPAILASLGLTAGVFNTDDGHAALTSLPAELAGALRLPYRRMEWTFVEGGGLITGILPSGEPYAITTGSPVEGARLLFEHRAGRAISVQEAAKLVAADLRVRPENLFVVDYTGHLDLIITPLPGGLILLSDPRLTAVALESMLAAAPPAAERARLENIHRLYTEGWRPAQSCAPPEYPYSDREVKTLDAVERALAGRLKVVRAAGIFREPELYQGSATAGYLADRINFFNGFTGAGPSGEVFQITNIGRGLGSLERYWRGLLARHGVARVDFAGSYFSGAGMDCLGAPSGR